PETATAAVGRRRRRRKKSHATLQDCSRLGDQKVEKESQKIGKEAKGKNSRDEALQDWYPKKKTLGRENVSKQERDESGKTKLFDYTTAAEKDVNVAEPVSNAGDVVNAASVILDVSATGPFTKRLQQEEREQFTVYEEARMLEDLTAERKRFFAAQRAEQSKYTHNQLKSKSFEEIQMIYEKEYKLINDFVPMDSEEVNDSKQQAKSSKKRSRAYHDKESVKKQKLEEDDAKKRNLELVWIYVILDVSATGPFTSTDGPFTSTTNDIFEDEMTTMPDTLMAIRRRRPRTTSVVIHDVEEEPRRATPPPTVQ
nr:hypothetical protein [Tanacetum cinerariifolium]